MALFGIFKSNSKKTKKRETKIIDKKAVPKKSITKKKSSPKKSESSKIKKVTKKTTAKKKVGLVKSTKNIKPKEIGRVTHYFGKISVGIIKLKAPLAVGDKIHIKGSNDDFKQTVKSMQVYHENLSKAKRGDEVGIKVSKKVHENDRVYMVNQ